MNLREEAYFSKETAARKEHAVSSSSLAGKPDLEIWREFKSDSEIAFAHIYREYFHTLYRYGSQFSRDRNFIKDAIQDLFVELLRKRRKLSDTTSIKYYLFKALKTTIISKLKKRRNDFGQEASGFGFTVSQEDKIINSQLDEEQKLRLHDALKKLKKNQREIIYYYYFEDLDLPRIASLLGFSNPKSAQNLLYRSLTVLKESLRIVVLLFAFLSLLIS